MPGKSIALVALKSFPHEGRSVTRGERFETSPIQAAVLTRARKATFAPAGAVLTRDLAPEPDPIVEPAPVAPTRRRYRRRDLTAEPA